MQLQRHPLLFSLLLLASASSASTQSPTVSPSDRTQLEGSTFTHLPLGRFNARVQTLHGDVPGGTVITGHAYRREAAGVYGTVGAFSVDLEVRLSMSPRTPDQASSTFASNAGSQPTVVLPRTVLTFPGTSRPSVDPAPGFDFVVPYATPFVVPAQGGTLCVDVLVYGNLAPSGPDRNFSVYLDGHELHANGDNEQVGYRYGSGCARAGGNRTAYGTLSFWHLGTSSAFDVGVRRGIAEDGSGLTRAWFAIGTQAASQPWPLLPQCTLYSSNDVWFPMAGTMTAGGRYDGTIANLPLLPSGFRLWCQTGSAHLGTGEVVFGDGVTLVTPPAGPQPLPARRIANSSDRTAATGSVSDSVPVTLFF